MFPDVQIVPGFSIKMFKKVGLSDIDDTVHCHRAEESLQYQGKGLLYSLISVKIDAMIQAFQGRDNGSEGS